MGIVQFPGEKYFPLSDVDKIKVIDKIEVADSESVFSLHENTKMHFPPSDMGGMDQSLIRSDLVRETVPLGRTGGTSIMRIKPGPQFLLEPVPPARV